MTTNRVEELETAVESLESTVEGLTEELVEAKERIRVLEAELDAETPTRVPERRSGESESEPAPESDDAGEETNEAAGGETEDSGSDDIIVA